MTTTFRYREIELTTFPSAEKEFYSNFAIIDLKDWFEFDESETVSDFDMISTYFALDIFGRLTLCRWKNNFMLHFNGFQLRGIKSNQMTVQYLPLFFYGDN